MAKTREQIIAAANKIRGGGREVSQELTKLIEDVLDYAIAGANIRFKVTNITELTKSQLDALNVGDGVVKVTGKQEHLYLVSYKGEGAGEGICLSYNAAGYGETVSYDRSGSSWVYNSTDIKTYGE